MFKNNDFYKCLFFQNSTRSLRPPLASGVAPSALRLPPDHFPPDALASLQKPISFGACLNLQHLDLCAYQPLHRASVEGDGRRHVGCRENHLAWTSGLDLASTEPDHKLRIGKIVNFTEQQPVDCGKNGGPGTCTRPPAFTPTMQAHTQYNTFTISGVMVCAAGRQARTHGA